MEEYDDLAQGPDEAGSFNLSYNDWRVMPYDLCKEYSNRLLYLNLSNNNLVEITEEIGSLTLLKELNLSHNNLTKIGKAMGRCIRLRKLDLSYNELVSIPIEVISQCKLLESLQFRNNKLDTLPDEICSLHALEFLDVRENNLESLPTELFSIQCLNKLHCDNNDKMTMIPKAMRGESQLVLWTLKLHQIYKDQTKKLKEDYLDIETNSKSVLMKGLLLEEERLRLEEEVAELEREKPVEYMIKKESFLLFMQTCKIHLRKCNRCVRDKVGYL